MTGFHRKYLKENHIFTIYPWKMHGCALELHLSLSRQLPPTFPPNIEDEASPLLAPPAQNQDHLGMRRKALDHSNLSTHRVTFSGNVKQFEIYEESVSRRMIYRSQSFSKRWWLEIWRLMSYYHNNWCIIIYQ